SFWAIWLLAVGGAWLFFRRTRGKTGKGRLVVGNLLVLLALLATVVLAGETYLRYVYDGTDTYSLMLTHRSWWKRHVRFNSTGLFRDREWAAAKAPGTTRVA